MDNVNKVVEKQEVESAPLESRTEEFSNKEAISEEVSQSSMDNKEITNEESNEASIEAQKEEAVEVKIEVKIEPEIKIETEVGLEDAEKETKSQGNQVSCEEEVQEEGEKTECCCNENSEEEVQAAEIVQTLEEAAPTKPTRESTIELELEEELQKDSKSVENEISAEEQSTTLSEEEQRQKNLALGFLKNAKLEYHSQYDRYELWALKCRDLAKEINELMSSIENTLIQFNKTYEESMTEDYDEAVNKFIKNRIKGIELIGKMLSKLGPSLKKLNEVPKLELLSFDYDTDKLSFMELNELKELENNCYNILSDLKGSTEKLIRDYFKFINSNILNIADGIESGLSFMEKKKLDNKAAKTIEHIYISLDLSFSDLFEKLQISKIEVKEGEEVNFKYHEVFDVEETYDKEKDEKICDVIRRGYIYYKPLFGMDYNYVLRPAQVIVYKCDK
ncbi:hypothetical protein GOM49_13525 [Clostridium bovifaecis]|uniref:Nucleotide exchange factor GrpE n=1 Tax=Clostridium bovifaecis TaxID=2184719 RepID=A0A6I6EUD6_9CLOT|nr:hypothetical protein GOM49_13525 [Clostridium bovifaecis]